MITFLMTYSLEHVTVYFHILFDTSFFVAFHRKMCVFIISISLFDEVSNFRNRILISQNPKFVTKNCQ